MSAAAQARRLREAGELEIVVLEQGPDVSYSACGIPYWVGGQVSDRDKLIARTPAQFAAQDIEVRIGTRAEAIDLDAGTVTTSAGETLGYDNLVVATGGRPLRPKVPGLDAAGRARRAPARRRRRHPGGRGGRARSGPSSSAGATSAWRWPTSCTGAGWTSPSSSPTPCPCRSWTSRWPSGCARRSGDMGIDMQTEQPVREIEVDADGVVAAVRTDAGSYPADLVVLGLGMGPEVALARDAGLRLGETGAIEVDRTQRSRSHPEVFAAGDCSQTYSRITGEALHVALGHARQQAGPGRGLGDRRAGGPLRRCPGDGADEGRRPGDRADRAVHHAGREGRATSTAARPSRGRRGPATTPAPRRSRSSCSATAAPGCCWARRSSAGRAAGSGSTSWRPPSGPG